MARRSERLKRSREDDLPVPAATAAPTVAPTAKRTRTESRVTRKHTQDTKAPARRRGKLYMMLDMPLDVILEICAHLNPKDIMNLSRTSRDLRNFFMSKNTLPLWKSAQLNLPGLPPCPPDLNEPAYANLMFSAHCHNCLSPNCYFVFWACRVRLCKKCRKELEKSHSKTLHYFSPGGNFAWTSRYMLSDLLPPLAVGTYSVKDNTYYTPIIDDVVAKIDSLSKAEVKAFCHEQKQAVSDLIKDMPQLQKFFESTRNSRAGELQDLRMSRLQCILERLTEDGWEDEVIYITEDPHREPEVRAFKSLPEVRKSQALTPKIWNNIEDAVKVAIRAVREKRLLNLRHETLVDRLFQLRDIIHEFQERSQYSSLKPIEIALRIPGLSEFVSPDTPTFDVQGLKDHLEVKLVEYMEKRDSNARKSIAKAIRKKLSLPASCDPFSLAIGAWFRCSPCREMYTIDNILWHQCSGGVFPDFPKRKDMSDEYYGRAKDIFYRGYIWDASVFNLCLSEKEAVIEACGLDAKTATAEDLDDADARLVCVNHCTYRPVMTWRTAIIHWTAECGGCKLEKATDDQAEAARALEPNAWARYCQKNENHRGFKCAYCRAAASDPQASGAKATVITHLRNQHDILEPTDEDWVDSRTYVTVPEPVYLLFEDQQGKSNREVEWWLQQGVAAYFKF